MDQNNSKDIKIVIDSSFWINITFLRLEEYLIKYFKIYFVSKVESEILNENKFKIYDSLDMEIYRSFKERNLFFVKDPQNVPKRLLDSLESNSGELYTVSLALEENATVFIDDGRPYNFCLKEKLFPVNSIDFVYFLYLKKDLNKSDSILIIDRLKGRIKSEYIEKSKKLFEV